MPIDNQLLINEYILFSHRARKTGEIELGGYKFILELVSDTKIETIRMIRLPEENSDTD